MESYDDAVVKFLADKANLRFALDIADRIGDVKKKLDRKFWEMLERKVREKLNPPRGWEIWLNKDGTSERINRQDRLEICPDNLSGPYLYPVIAYDELWYGIARNEAVRGPVTLREVNQLQQELQEIDYKPSGDGWWLGYKKAAGGVKLGTNQMYVRIAQDDHLEEELSSALVALFQKMRTLIERANKSIARGR